MPTSTDNKYETLPWRTSHLGMIIINFLFCLVVVFFIWRKRKRRKRPGREEEEADAWHTTVAVGGVCEFILLLRYKYTLCLCIGAGIHTCAKHKHTHTLTQKKNVIRRGGREASRCFYFPFSPSFSHRFCIFCPQIIQLPQMAARKKWRKKLLLNIHFTRQRFADKAQRCDNQLAKCFCERKNAAKK